MLPTRAAAPAGLAPEAAAGEHPRRWRMLALLALGQILGMAPWFSASAVAPGLAARWGLDLTEIGWLTGAVQLGFVAGTAGAALLNLADILPSRAYFAGSALLAAAANAALVAAPGLGPALASRFLTGAFLAGVYPPAMKMIATWFRRERGLAIGTVVGALTVGKATPYLVKALEARDVESVVLGASAGPLVAGLAVALAYREGPFSFERPRFSWALAGTVLAHRPTRLAVGGYLGHMWELYAMWTWVPAFCAASLAARAEAAGGALARAPGASGAVEAAATAGAGAYPSALADLLAFGAIAAGGLGCLWGGWEADRWGRERLVNRAMAASGLCCLGVGLAFGGSPWLLALVAWTWGFFVVADSAQFSTLVTEVAPRHAVGTALTLQTSMGFLLTLATIQLVPHLVAAWGWRWAFPLLALGPAAGIASIRRLEAVRAER